MNKIYFILLLILFSGQAVIAQDNPIIIKKSMFNKQGEIKLADLDGWIFHKGNDPSWSNPNYDISNWGSFRPIDLSSELEDDQGKVEGWFRLKFKLDDSIKNEKFYLERQLWAATDIFINGKLVASFGNTSKDGYKEYNPKSKIPQPLQLEPGHEYVLAMHFVNYEHPLMLRELQLKPKNLQWFLNLSGVDYFKIKSKNIMWSYIWSATAISITALLMIFFWVLVVQNKKEKIFRIIALLASIVFVHAVVEYYIGIFETTYAAKIGLGVVWALVAPFIVSIDLIIVEKIVGKRVPYLSVGILVVFPPVSLLAHIYDISAPFSIVNSIFLLYFAYLVFKSWKTLSRDQIAVIVGTVVNVLSIMIMIGLHKYYYGTAQGLENILMVIYFLSIPLSLLIYVAFRFNGILNEIKSKANELVKLSEEKKEILANQNILLEKQVTERTAKLNQSLIDLKATQSQLIQSEKMASLGELTAGIAHEIQNPLNFVNNFSEVSNELIDEMNEEIAKGELDEAQDIANDVKQNLEKINHHGKRAEAIVKGMLQHSRSSSGEKEPTDINALADEYLRLAYHGLRAKDKSFNATMETDFDENIGSINIIPQDIGRVILNLITNAFYAVNEKKLQTPEARLPDGQGYEPTVTVSTKKINGKVEIKVKDNGNGIPVQIKDKIFQPFFTTKATGEGTGLGLSLSYDIIKAHEGELNLLTGEGKGSTFIILLPN